jgi:Rrf2 family iron-sulfur cluster assembly transcriptional regulator
MLELAHEYGRGTVQSHDIATRQEVPEPYLNQLLTQLRKAGLIVSRRGPGGGHCLARPAGEINLADLVAALEGPLGSTEDGTETRRGSCLALRELWQEVNQQVEQLLHARTLADLVEREKKRSFTYYI